MKKKTVILLIAIILIIVAVVTVSVSGMLGREELTYDKIDENGNTVIVKENDIKSSLTLSKGKLRKDIETILATVNGKDITAYDLNIARTIQAFGELNKEYTDKELLNIIIKDLVVYEYTAKNGYVYAPEKENGPISDSENANLSGSLSDYEIYASSSGLDEKSYADMEYRVDEKLKTYSEYLDIIMEPLLGGEIGVEDEEYEKNYAEYKSLIAVDSMEEIDMDSVNACTNELVERYTQHLIDEADVVIYEDRLN